MNVVLVICILAVLAVAFGEKDSLRGTTKRAVNSAITIRGEDTTTPIRGRFNDMFNKFNAPNVKKDLDSQAAMGYTGSKNATYQSFGTDRGWIIARQRMESNDCTGPVSMIQGSRLGCQETMYGYNGASWYSANVNSCDEGSAFVISTNVNYYDVPQGFCKTHPQASWYAAYWWNTFPRCTNSAHDWSLMGSLGTECSSDTKYNEFIRQQYHGLTLEFYQTTDQCMADKAPQSFNTFPQGGCIPFGMYGSAKITSCSGKDQSFTYNYYYSNDCTGSVWEYTDNLMACESNYLPGGHYGLGKLVCH